MLGLVEAGKALVWKKKSRKHTHWSQTCCNLSPTGPVPSSAFRKDLCPPASLALSVAGPGHDTLPAGPSPRCRLAEGGRPHLTDWVMVCRATEFPQTRGRLPGCLLVSCARAGTTAGVSGGRCRSGKPGFQLQLSGVALSARSTSRPPEAVAGQPGSQPLGRGERLAFPVPRPARRASLRTLTLRVPARPVTAAGSVAPGQLSPGAGEGVWTPARSVHVLTACRGSSACVWS